MPELPEVEHARRRMLAILGEGARITGAASLDPLVIEQPAEDFPKALVGRRVATVERLGKNLLVSLEGEVALWFHLGMTGRVAPSATGASELPRFTRWWIESEKARVCLVDPRRLGRGLAGPSGVVRARAKWDALGPDALALTSGEALRAALTSRAGKPTLKAALMDQQRLAGVGNIQAIEALFRAKLAPSATLDRLGPAGYARLAEGLAATLEHTLRTMRDDEDVVYVESGGPNPFLVYGREGAPCPRCAAPIRREVTAGRSTYFCARCQRARSQRPNAQRTNAQRPGARRPGSGPRGGASR